MEEPDSLLNNFREALQKSLQVARAPKVEFRRVDAAGHVVYAGLEEFIEHFDDRLRDENEDITTLAGQLLHLYTLYFPLSTQLQLEPTAITSMLAVKANRVHSGRLWPEGCWLGSHYLPNPVWLRQQEMENVFGLKAETYKQVLRQLGFGPVHAPSKDALDQIWHSLYNSHPDIRTRISERYAVVSYVQYAQKQAPNSWAMEVDAVLTAMADMGIISEKAVWFDKLASRQYEDSQKWWGATATMQFLFNPVIVILPRVSEREEFTPEVKKTLWGSEEADDMFARFVRHAKSCSKCQESYVLEWALKQDQVMPIATLRTWPRVEHQLGAHGLGLFTSEITYAALAALLTCSYAMFSTLFSASRGTLLNELLRTGAPPSSTYVKEDGSVQVGWVNISCTSNWLQNRNPVKYVTTLREMASLSAELVRLFCNLHTPKLLSRNFLAMSTDEGAADLRSNIDTASGLYYPAEDSMYVDVPIMIRFNTNELRGCHTDHTVLSSEAYAQLQMYWAYVSMSENFCRVTTKDMDSAGSLIARRKAVEVLVYGRAGKAPCFSWDDKLVAVILLSSPSVFLEAVDHWHDQVKLSKLTKGLRESGILDESQDIEWVPNTLIAVLAVTGNQSVHRLLPCFMPMRDNRRVCLGTLRNAANDHHVQAARVTTAKQKGWFSRLCRSLLPCGVKTGGRTKKCFLGYFAGHLPLVTVDALPFKTTRATALPSINDYVYRKLQEASLCDSNMVVVGQPWTDLKEQQAGQCWHCQELLAHGFETPGAAQAPTEWLIPLYSDYTPPPGIHLGLGSFDPLNVFSLVDPDVSFGCHPDSIAVLLERNRDNSVHAATIVCFGLLGASNDSKQVCACATCYNVIVYDYNYGDDVLNGVWTLMPIFGYNLAELRDSGIDVIR
ncbi:hypothetical protein L7F22_017615 [Adiantum nelumboides]|nr:hypothetical protein [Adiantum nelumboides]